MQASKWLKIAVLADAQELAQLFSQAADAKLIPFGQVVDAKDTLVSLDSWLATYSGWIEELKQGHIPTAASLRRLPLAWTLEDRALTVKEVPHGRFLLQPYEPVVQIQAHFFRYSPVDHSLRSMVFSQDTIFWGLQFSYPQIYQDPQTTEIVSTRPFPNTALFQRVRSWLRDTTRSTPFLIQGEKVASSIRMGKAVAPWIHRHPQLRASGLRVQEALND